jgi:hypothetical protein
MTGHRTDGDRGRETTIETKNTRHKEVSLLAKPGVAVEKVRFPQISSLASNSALGMIPISLSLLALTITMHRIFISPFGRGRART